ncbi:MAG: HNH endonuclease [Balneolales bacterium]
MSHPLENLNVDRTPRNWDERTRNGAPHKPFLLLSILDGLDQGWITGNKIELSQELIETFRMYWNGIIGEHRATTIALPFYHMNSEPFWRLVYADGAKPYANSPSLGGLKNRIRHAEIEPAMFEEMSNPASRKRLWKTILNRYFSPETTRQVTDLSEFNNQTHDYAGHLDSLAANPFQVDHTGEKEIQYRVTRTAVRDIGFSLSVRRAYNYTCTICRSRLMTPTGYTLVDGAHIIPFNSSQNNDPRNGLALCKSHHWMFDHFMLTIGPDYKIRLSNWLDENDNRVEDVKKWDHLPMALPDQHRFHPARAALEHHFHMFRERQ